MGFIYTASILHPDLRTDVPRDRYRRINGGRQEVKNELMRALYWDMGIPRPPYRIDIHPTTRSNLPGFRCWCAREMDEGEEADVEAALLFKLVSEGCSIGVKEWVITGGGEPLLMKEELTRIMSIIKDNMCYGELHTYGTMFSESFISDTVEMGWDRIVICLAAPEAEMNDRIIETEGAYVKILEGLEMLQDMKEEVGSSLPAVEIYMPLAPASLGEVGNMMKFCKRKGIDTLVIAPLGYRGSSEELRLDEEELARFQHDIPRYRALSRSLRMDIEIEPAEMPYRPETRESKPDTDHKKNKKEDREEKEETGELDPDKVYCLEPFLNMVIRPSGGIGPCYVSRYDTEKDQEKLSHRMLEKKGLDDIWYGHFFTMLRENAKIGPPASYCAGCTPELQRRQLEILGGLRLNRDRFMEHMLKQIMKDAEKDEEGNKEIQKRLERIAELKGEMVDMEEELQTMRGYHIELERIRSSKLFRFMRSLRIIRE